MNEILDQSLADAARQIKSKSISPVELTIAALERIEATEGKLNAFVRLNADSLPRWLDQAVEHLVPMLESLTSDRSMFEWFSAPTFRTVLERRYGALLGLRLGVSRSELEQATDLAEAALGEFEERMTKRGHAPRFVTKRTPRLAD